MSNVKESTKKMPPRNERVQVTLLKKHTHAGIDYEPGADIEITPAQADRLKAQGVI